MTTKIILTLNKKQEKKLYKNQKSIRDAAAKHLGKHVKVDFNLHTKLTLATTIITTPKHRFTYQDVAAFEKAVGTKVGGTSMAIATAKPVKYCVK